MSLLRPAALLLLLALVTSAPARAQDATAEEKISAQLTQLKAETQLNELCNDNRTHAIDNALKALDKVEPWIPQVTAEEDAMFTRDYIVANKELDPGKLGLIWNRPHFYTWNIHRAFKEARTELENNKKLPSMASVKNQISEAAYLPYKMTLAQNAFSDFAMADNRVVLTLEQTAEGTFALLGAAGDLSLYISCLASTLPDK